MLTILEHEPAKAAFGIGIGQLSGLQHSKDIPDAEQHARGREGRGSRAGRGSKRGCSKVTTSQ